MPLFQQSVLQKHLNDLNKEQLRQAWLLYQQHFFNAEIRQNIRNSKEEEYQEGFVRDLFVTVLGYTLNPQPGYNFVLEKKTIADATKSDGAILVNDLTPDPSRTIGTSSPKERGEMHQVIAVVELKDTGTPDLDKVSTQAFGYKHKHKNCIYVITSNFEKLRFYINDATDYEEFNLFTLTQERFALLYLCLHRQNLLANIPLQVKQASLVQEENVTQKLYADYSLFKRTLFQNIAEQNPQHDKLLLFKKTQKLLDRFLFILFAEDRLLVPPNSVREILKQWEQLKDMDNYVPLYDRFKKYFGYLNAGHVGKHYEIFAYNGGLFLPDEVLDTITIDDAILFKGTTTLSNYDYNTEIDVNILGHIFEHSLTEIEELQLELEGRAIEKGKTKRKKEGVFYTPRYITKYIVENTVGALCTQKKEELQINEEAFAPQKRKANRKALLEKIEAYRQWLLQLTICDPACGSGAFLNAALIYLKAEHRTLDELTARVHDAPMVLPEMDNEILEHNLYGVDINEDAIEIAKLSLWLHTAKKGRKLSNLSNNIKVGNSLIDDPAVAGDKAFNWKEEFKDVFDKGGFDVVIGNPPYGATFINTEIDYLRIMFQTVFEYQVNSYVLFFQKGIDIIAKDGTLGYITPATYTYQHYFKRIRNFIQQFKTISIAKYFYEVFNDADIGDSVIYILKKTPNDRGLITVNLNTTVGQITPATYVQTFDSLVNSDGTYNLNNKGLSLSMFLNSNYTLENAAEIVVGVKPYQVGKGTPKQTREAVNEKKFTSDHKKDSTFINCVIGKDFFRYVFLKKPSMYLSYGKWLAEPRDSAPFFDDEKIILRQTSDSLIAHYDDQRRINLNNVYNVGKKDLDINLKYLLTLLNSKLLNFIYQAISQEEGRLFAEVKRVNLAKLPIKKVALNSQQPFIAKADIMLEKNKELNQLSEQFTKLLQAKFPTVNINNKLQQWHSLTASNFLKELSKQKIKLSLQEQQEWLQYFEQQKEKAGSIQQTIQQTDKEIDAMVYQLYGLTEDEIAVVESK